MAKNTGRKSVNFEGIVWWASARCWIKLLNFIGGEINVLFSFPFARIVPMLGNTQFWFSARLPALPDPNARSTAIHHHASCFRPI